MTLLTRSFVVLLLATGSAAAQADPEVLWRDVRQPEEGIDLVFLPDGFTVDELEDFEASVKMCIELLERQKASFVRQDREVWNMHVGFVPSKTSCPAQPSAKGGRTAFETRVSLPDEGGMFESDEVALLAAARGLSPGVDCTVLILRLDQPGSWATGNLPGEGSVVRLPEGLESLLLHELGHSLFALGDEYESGCEDRATHQGRFAEHERAVVPFYPNVTLDPSGKRFKSLARKRVKLEEGTLYHRLGVWRAAEPCVMRTTSANRFCSPCAAVIAAGLPAGPPERAPVLKVKERKVKGRSERRATLEPGRSETLVIRGLAVLVRIDEAWDESEAAARVSAADARLSRKTRYMESAWIADGSLPGERVFSLEGHVRTFALGELEPGEYVLLAATANLLGLSPVASARFRVP